MTKGETVCEKIWFALFLVALDRTVDHKLKRLERPVRRNRGIAASPWQSTIIGLPDYDLRRELAEIQALSRSIQSSDAPVVQARTDAMKTFALLFHWRVATVCDMNSTSGRAEGSLQSLPAAIRSLEQICRIRLREVSLDGTRRFSGWEARTFVCWSSKAQTMIRALPSCITGKQ